MNRVDIDWENAPKEADRYIEIHSLTSSIRYEGFAYKDRLGRYQLVDNGLWTDKVDVEVMRPAEQPYMPQVGQECLAYEYSTKKERESIYIGDDPRGKGSTWKAFSSITTGQPFFSDRYEFRPLKTQAEIERDCHMDAIEANLQQADIAISEEAINIIGDYIIGLENDS